MNFVCPVFNRKEFVALTLRSLDKYLDFDKVDTFLLLDDMSTDGAGEVARAWAADHAKARYVRKRNPSMATAWPLYEGFDLLGEPEWTAIWLSDWYLCEPLMPVLERAMALGGEEVEVVTSRTLRVTSDKQYTPRDILTAERRTDVHGSISGGFNAFRASLLRRARSVAEVWGSISGTFNGLLRQAGISFRAQWISPPPAFLHLDEDIPGNSLTQHFYRAEGLDTAAILAWVERYARKAWSRNEVAPDGKTVQRAHCAANPKLKQWIRKGVACQE